MIPVVVPAKPLAQALGRLAGVLRADQRRALQAAMLRDVLAAAREFSDRVVVVSADRSVSEIARQLDVRVAPDHDPPNGINAAVERGVEAIADEAVMVVMGDLPAATADDLRQVALAGTGVRGITCAISHDGTGTNAMLLRPAQVIRPAFGPGSLAHHLARARIAGCEATVITAPGLMLDIDTPDDLRVLAAAPGTSATGSLVATFDLARHLSASGAA